MGSSCRGAAEVDREGYVVPSHYSFYGFDSRIPLADPGANALSESIPVCTRWCFNRHFLGQWRYLWLRVQRDCELGRWCYQPCLEYCRRPDDYSHL